MFYLLFLLLGTASAVAQNNNNTLRFEINGEQYFEKSSGELIYNYVTNEHVTIKCHKPVPIFGNLHFECIHNFATAPESSNFIKLEKVMNDADQFTNLSCVFIHGNKKKTLTVQFHPAHNQDVDNFIKINGNLMKPINGEVYYEYYYGEPVVMCHGRTMSAGAPSCLIKGKNVTIKLSKRLPNNGIVIEGLSDKKIKMESYENDNKTRKFYYGYEHNEMLNVSASYVTEADKGNTHKPVQFSLRIFGEDNPMEPEQDSHIGSSNFQLTLTKECNNGSILVQPIDPNIKTRTIIILQYVDKNEEDPTYGTPTASSTLGENSSNMPYKSGDFKDWLKENDKQLIGGGLVVIFILIAIYIVILLIKRRKHNAKGSQSQVDYVNLRHNDCDKQFPKRLNAARYIDTKPKETDDYAVPVDVNYEETYSVPFRPNIEDMYTAIIPKNERGKSDVTYAEIQLNRPSIHSDGVNSKSSSDYAEIVPVKDKDKNKRTNYVNKFDNTLYVNATDVVEPAYCELGVLKK